MNKSFNQSNQSNGLIRISNLIHDVFNDIDTTIKENEDKMYVKTGFSNLDSMITGFKRGDLIVIGSRPGMGKTSLSLNLAYRMSKNNCSIAYFNFEYSGKDIVKRILSIVRSIPSKNLDSGKLDFDDMKNIVYAASEFSDKQLFLCDAKNITVNDMEDECKKLKDNYGLDAVIIDYLQLISFEKDLMNNSKHDSLNRNEELDIIVRSLKTLAKDLDVPIIVLSQLCRNADKKDVPEISDLLIYGDIEKHFDTIIFVSDKAKDSCEPSRTDIFVAKNNDFKTGTINLRFDRGTGSFNEYEE